MSPKEIGEIVHYHRKKSGLSRIRCAQLAGIGKTAIYDIEHGKPTVQLNTLLSLFVVLNIKMQLVSPLLKNYYHEKG